MFEDGVKKSFDYLEEDLNLLFQKDWKKNQKLYKFTKSSPQIDIKKVDLITKELGVIMTKAQRDEVVKTNFSCVIQGKIAIDSNEKEIYISPYIKTTMPKEFKEKMRKEKIPPKIRGYVYSIENEKCKVEN
jgi:tRNA(Ile)-lysidine synthase